MRLQTCSQMWFDPILRDFALSSPCVTLRHRTRLESFSDNGSGVSAEIVDLESGRRELIKADYLVGCDGAMSAIRGQLGIRLTGQGVLGHPLHLFSARRIFSSGSARRKERSSSPSIAAGCG
jgi:2-polyprenyl-6-methoxyphenol hydroxylase-like FAD-dependent oxidoreductase